MREVSALGVRPNYIDCYVTRVLPRRCQTGQKTKQQSW